MHPGKRGFELKESTSRNPDLINNHAPFIAGIRRQKSWKSSGMGTGRSGHSALREMSPSRTIPDSAGAAGEACSRGLSRFSDATQALKCVEASQSWRPGRHGERKDAELEVRRTKLRIYEFRLGIALSGGCGEQQASVRSLRDRLQWVIVRPLRGVTATAHLASSTYWWYSHEVTMRV